MPTTPVEEGQPVLLVRAGGRTCALDLSQVVEIMRPLPVHAVAGAPEAVSGLAVVRGVPLAVVALDRVLVPGEAPRPASRAPRFVVVRAGARQVVLAVDTVTGVYEFDRSLRASIPPLLQHAAGEALDAIGRLDSDLLMVLDAARIVPDEMWHSLEGVEA